MLEMFCFTQTECLHLWRLHRLGACHSAVRASAWFPAFSGRWKLVMHIG